LESRINGTKWTKMQKQREGKHKADNSSDQRTKEKNRIGDKKEKTKKFKKKPTINIFGRCREERQGTSPRKPNPKENKNGGPKKNS